MAEATAQGPKQLIAVRDAREKAIARLTDHFTKDELEMEEFEDRLSKAHRLETVEEIEKLLADLPSREIAPAPKTALVPAAEVRPSATLMAIFGGVDRSGSWAVPKHVNSVAVMGGTNLDLREARLAPGVTEISVFALMGGVNIIVPPTLAVETHGTAIMGGFAQLDRAPASPDPDAPVLRVGGFAFLGGVNVETRLPGESEHDARRRRRKERKALAKANR
jgi:hypothetical protein